VKSVKVAICEAGEKRTNVDIRLTHRRRWKHSNAIQMRFKFDPRPLSLNFIRPLAYRVVGGRAPQRGTCSGHLSQDLRRINISFLFFFV